MKKVVGLGACVLDTLIQISAFPAEDTKQKAERTLSVGGGPVSNALVVMSKLGLTTSIIGNFADDDTSGRIINEFEKYNVNTDFISRIKDTKSFTSYVLLSEKDKTRTCIFDRGTVPDNPDAVDYSCLNDADVLHLDGNYINCAINAAKTAKKKNVKVSLDAGGVYEDIEKLLPFVDILIPSSEFALKITGKTEIADAVRVLYEKYKPEILVVTDGINGGYYYDEKQVKCYNSVKVNAIDTNGAGDTFHGAFIVAYCSGKGVKECCEFASTVAAYKCTQFGARNYPLSLEVIDNILKNK